MTNEMNNYKKDLGYKWVKADSGNTYLCPVKSLQDMNNPSEDDLRSICVDESNDPQNS